MNTPYVHFCFGAVYRLFFTSKSVRAAFHSAPSMDLGKRTMFSSLSEVCVLPPGCPQNSFIHLRISQPTPLLSFFTCCPPPSLHPLCSVVEGLLWTCFCQHWTMKLESMAVDWHAEYLSAIFQLPNSKPIVGFGSRSSRTARWALQRLNVFNQKPNLSRIFSVFLLVPTLIFPVIPAVTFSLHSHTLDTRELSGGLVCSWFGTGPEYCFVFFVVFLALYTSVKHLFTAVVHFEHKQPESEADVRCGPGLITQCVSVLHYFNPLCLR